jgi:hypothetical protein
MPGLNSLILLALGCERTDLMAVHKLKEAQGLE